MTDGDFSGGGGDDGGGGSFVYCLHVLWVLQTRTHSLLSNRKSLHIGDMRFLLKDSKILFFLPGDGASQVDVMVMKDVQMSRHVDVK